MSKRLEPIAVLARCLLGITLSVCAATHLWADRVERADGSAVEGRVTAVDEQTVRVRTDRGEIAVPRREVVSIHFATEVHPLKVELRNVRSDDSVEVLLDQETVIREAREGGSWVDLTPKLKEGNNPVRLRVRNARGAWAYHVEFRINGKLVPLSCGKPGPPPEGCRCCGKTGLETGEIDDLPVVWIWVDRALGTAEVIP